MTNEEISKVVDEIICQRCSQRQRSGITAFCEPCWMEIDEERKRERKENSVQWQILQELIEKLTKRL